MYRCQVIKTGTATPIYQLSASLAYVELTNSETQDVQEDIADSWGIRSPLWILASPDIPDSEADVITVTYRFPELCIPEGDYGPAGYREPSPVEVSASSPRRDFFFFRAHMKSTKCRWLCSPTYFKARETGHE